MTELRNYIVTELQNYGRTGQIQYSRGAILNANFTACVGFWALFHNFAFFLNN